MENEAIFDALAKLLSQEIKMRGSFGKDKDLAAFAMCCTNILDDSLGAICPVDKDGRTDFALNDNRGRRIHTFTNRQLPRLAVFLWPVLYSPGPG